jgi:hypothetical protein
MSGKLLHRRAALIPVLVIVLLACMAISTASAAERFALVIGNADYPTAPLRNPVNDARAMTRALRELGFDVSSLENADKQRMEQAIVGFASRLKENSSGLFYYAGHGVQVNGRNYLVPVGAEIDSEREIRFETVGVHVVLEELGYAGNRINIVILDACRNNPFERRLRGGGARGLAAIDAARGTLIAYATAPGSVALDGDGRNGIYTEELLGALRSPGLQVEEVFKQVRVGVARRTKNQQIPWESSSLTGSFVFNGSAGPSTARSSSGSEMDLLFWQSVSGSDNPDAYRAYLRQFPQGTFADLAGLRILELEAASASPAASGVSGAATAASKPDVSGAGLGATASAFDYDGDVGQGTQLAKAQPAPSATRGKRDTPYVIAVVAPSGLDPGFCWQELDSRAMAEVASRRIQGADGFAFLHRYYHAEDTRALWRRSGMRSNPIDREVFAYGRSSGVDGVLVVKFDSDSRACGDVEVETILYDIAGDTAYRRQGDASGIDRMTDGLVDEFARKRAAAR